MSHSKTLKEANAERKTVSTAKIIQHRMRNYTVSTNSELVRRWMFIFVNFLGVKCCASVALKYVGGKMWR
jgi:hypothetical protein